MSGIRSGACLITMMLCVVGTSHAQAQAFGEQAPVQFKFNNTAETSEIYRQQLGASAAAAASSGLGGYGYGLSGQSSSQTTNGVTVTNTYNVTMSGSNDTLNVQGATVNANQTSTGTTQTSANTQGNTTNNTKKHVDTQSILNK